MSWVNMLPLWLWPLMLLVPPLIVMLYFLKLRRMPLVVPSTYLWQRTIEDLHVNSIWQRLRKNLLLLLQLLAVLALIVALLRPGFRGDRPLGNRAIFMIDNSSSMQATDLGSSRLEIAKEEALSRVNGMLADDVGMVIAFSDRADVKQGFTSDKQRLREAINSIQPTNRTTDLNEALRAASGLANPGRTSQIEDMGDVQVAEARPATVYILSDGGFTAPQLDLDNLTAEYEAIGSDSPFNVAILAFTVERNMENPGQIEAFARLQNFNDQPISTTASLYLDDELIDATEVELDPIADTGVSFQLSDLVQGRLRLEVDVKDDFLIDNQAFAGLDPPRQLEVVLVSDGNTALESALSTSPAKKLASVRVVDPTELESPVMQQLSDSGAIDLFIYDRCGPQKMPRANTLFFGSLPPDERWSAGEPQGPLFIIDTNRSHPLLQYVDMGTVRIVEGRSIEPPTGASELLRTDAGILMAVAPREAFQDAVVGMGFYRETEDGPAPNTDWPIKRSFPVFVLNALEYLGGAFSSAGATSVQPGQPATLNLASRFNEVDLVLPDGIKRRLQRNGQPRLVFTQTDSLGFYQTRPVESEQTLQMFTVNLFSERESNIVPANEVQIGVQTVADENAGSTLSRVELWRWLLVLALVILTVEWYLYNRRVTV